MNTETELYQTCTGVYCGTRQLPIKEQRGRRYVNFKGRQINIKDIPEQEQNDPVFDYIFNYGWRNNPNPEMDRMVKERIAGDQKNNILAKERIYQFSSKTPTPF